jgi:hypothetical protein
MLILGDADSSGDAIGATGDREPATAPAPATNPVAPPAMESSSPTSERPMLDEVNDDAISESRWIAAFVDSETPVIADQTEEESNVANVSVALVVAMVLCIADRRDAGPTEFADHIHC